MHNPVKDFDEVFFAMCKSQNTPFSLSLWLRWKHRCYSAARRPRPQDYDDSYTFSRDYLLYSWPRKAKVNLEKRDLRAVALEGFKADELYNAETTARLRKGMAQGFGPDYESVIHRLRRKIASILGPLDVVKCLNGCRLGGGATNTLSRKQARRDKKIVTLPMTVSPAARYYGVAVLESDPGWLRAIGINADGPCCLIDRNIVLETDYNLFDTVPKDLSTHRTIAKEPMLNGLLQQGVHLFMRSALLRAGVDLRDQTQNQIWASLAQSLGLCTLDLKSASNSTVTALVELLFPLDWFQLLDCLRSRRTLIPETDECIKTHMFSSMGNAFTFELESLIFFAVLSTVCEPNQIISVYGDDLICPAHKAERVVEILTLLGYRINMEKSFISGRFYESCGKHYFDGTDVTPAYQKEPPRVTEGETLRSHNRLIRWARRSGGGVVLDSFVKPACALLARDVDPKLHGPIGPEEDSWLQVPYGTYRVMHGFASVHYLYPVPLKSKTKKRRLSIQRASYAYYLRLKSQGLPVRPDDWHSVDGIRATPFLVKFYREEEGPWLAPGLQLSEAPRSFSSACVIRRKSIPLDQVWGVELQWA